MEPAQAKPVKKRRRWLIVTVVLVLATWVSWWYWPRGDARFVGKWQKENTRSGVDQLIFHRNGLYEERSSAGGTKFLYPYRVDGDTLVVGGKPSFIPVKYVEPVLLFWAKTTGYWFLGQIGESRMDFSFDGPDVLVMQHYTDRGFVAVRFRRIPE